MSCEMSEAAAVVRKDVENPELARSKPDREPRDRLRFFLHVRTRSTQKFCGLRLLAGFGTDREKHPFGYGPAVAGRRELVSEHVDRHNLRRLREQVIRLGHQTPRNRAGEMSPATRFVGKDGKSLV